MLSFKRMLALLVFAGFLASPLHAEDTALSSEGSVILGHAPRGVLTWDASAGTLPGPDERLKDGEAALLGDAGVQLGNLRLIADYRCLDILLDDRDMLADTNVSGLYAGALVRF